MISTSTCAVYGDTYRPLAFRLGNGGAGHTGLLRLLCETFIATRGSDFKIEWVSNHSRHSQIALLGDVVQVALTYEPEYEDLAVQEGWAIKVNKVFNDHFILVGPKSDPAGVKTCRSISSAMHAIAKYGSDHGGTIFETRGDGSATFYKELALWKNAGVVVSNNMSWRQTKPGTPYEALVNADQTGAYIITDRATYLTARRDGVLSLTIPMVEGGSELWNPCSALINSKTPYNRLAREFASWLGTDKVQEMIHEYGRSWSIATPIFSKASHREIGGADRLQAKL